MPAKASASSQPTKTATKPKAAKGSAPSAGKAAQENSLSKKYQKKTAREHVLDNPDTYIGSVEKVDTPLHIFDDSKGEGKHAIVEKTIDWIPGLYKIFDEGVVNARDHVIRMAQLKASGQACNKVTHIDVSISDDGTITITNDGNGIDVEKHPEHDIWIPEMVFGHLRTSTNYNKDEKKIVGGKNGFGFKLALIWSTWGRVETVDHTRKKKYIQEYHNNLTVIDPPSITRCANKPYTSVSFKPDYVRFGMPGGPTPDFLALLRRRVYDIAAVTDKDVKVKWNGELLPVKNFQQYIDLYIGDKEEAPRAYESSNERWEYAVTLAPNDEFQQVSFVNGIFTAKGGKHVDYLLNQIVRKLTAYIKNKKKVDVKPAAIKEQLMLFVRCDIENPTFDSQTKDYMNSAVAHFGSTCEVSDKFVEKIAKMGVMQAACAITEVKQNKAAKKTDGTRSRTIRGIPKLLDANDAGTSNGWQCELLLVEGDSAKAGVVSGLTTDDRKRIGVYPLKGKLLNVRGEALKKIAENKEITEIKQILGLQNGKEYKSLDDIKAHLRYGKVVFLTDQDLDGTHIKGLGINLFQSLWESLSKIPGFLSFMNTPILKAKKGAATRVFYNEGEYEEWKGENDGNTRGWHVKYYKGLGTSTGKEFREYFQAKKLVDFVREDVVDDDQIDMVFNKKRADDRKTWLSQYDRTSFLDTNKPTVSYRDFIHKEMIHFSNYDNDRSLPNLMDGLKISLRKILFSAFKRKLTSEIKVAQFSGYVSEHSGYHHGEASLNAAIVGMAQDFVGSNNINLFVPNGQFGTRLQGGKDSASERYIFTQLNPITRFIYPEADDQVLSHKVDDGQKVEPKYYAPIIPMLLVNGSTGIGTGFSTNVMTYNPQDIINRLRHLLQTGQAGVDTPIRPYSEGFTGEITMEDDKYVISGKYEIKDATHIHISELPIGTWTDSFKEHLEKCLDGTARGSKAKDGNPHIKSYMDMSTDTVVSISVTFAKGSIDALAAEEQPYGKNGIDKLLGLYTTHSRNNMYMFDADEKLVKYSSAEEILDAFIPTRLKMYELRKAAQIDKLEHELCEVSNKAKFIKYNLQDKIDLRRKSEQQVEELLTKFKFDKKDDSFNYLRKLPMDSVTEEKVKQLLKEEKDKQEELAELSGKTEKQIWLEELEVLDAKYAEFREAKKISEADDQPKMKSKGATKTATKKRVVKKKVAKA